MPKAKGLAECLDQVGRSVAFRRAAMGEKPSGVPMMGALLDAVGLFERLGIGYALVGGIAAMVYGRARFTEDVDFVAARGHEEAFTRNPAVMREFGFDPACVWKLYHRSGVEIDLWKDEYVEGIVQRAREVELSGRKVRVAEVHDLVAMKLRAGRLQDDYDIGEIIKAGGIDETVLRGLVTGEQWGRYEGILGRVRGMGQDNGRAGARE